MQFLVGGEVEIHSEEKGLQFLFQCLVYCWESSGLSLVLDTYSHPGYEVLARCAARTRLVLKNPFWSWGRPPESREEERTQPVPKRAPWEGRRKTEKKKKKSLLSKVLSEKKTSFRSSVKLKEDRHLIVRSHVKKGSPFSFPRNTVDVTTIVRSCCKYR